MLQVVAVDPCIIAEALVRIYNRSGIGRDRPQEYPEFSVKRFRHLLNSLEAGVPRECDLKDNYKLERAAFLLTAAPRAGNFMSGKMTQQQISSAICMSDSTLRR